MFFFVPDKFHIITEAETSILAKKPQEAHLIGIIQLVSQVLSRLIGLCNGCLGQWVKEGGKHVGFFPTRGGQKKFFQTL